MKNQGRGRPQCRRIIRQHPEHTYFKPAGIPRRVLKEIHLTIDEFEALRLVDYDGMYHEKAADSMGVSRPTFGRIVESARRKTVDALLHGKALRIEGGSIMERQQDVEGPGGACICVACGKSIPHVAGQPCREMRCPDCGKHMLREGSAHHQAYQKKNNNDQGE
jgi:uncharacterized protein